MSAVAATVTVADGHSKYTGNLKPNDSIITGASRASCLRNREFILTILKKYLTSSEEVFEIGTGTADQTIYFCEHLPNITWQTSDRIPYHDQIRSTLKEAGFPNKIVKEPLAFDIDTEDEIPRLYDVIYASNVLHCIPEESAEMLFRKVSTALKVNGLFILYGPFKQGDRTSEGNKKFDERLQKQDPRLGLREISAIKQLAQRNDLTCVDEHLQEVVNNHVLVFKKT